MRQMTVRLRFRTLAASFLGEKSAGCINDTTGSQRERVRTS
jgi:hypothetical protein